MPRYFFNIHDGEDLPDKVGTVLPDDEAARLDAIRASGDMLRDGRARFWTGQDWTMEVTEGDRVVAKLRFSGTIES